MPVVASYVTTFLKPEMLHIYRQITGLKQFDTFVVAKTKSENVAFPFPENDIEIFEARSAQFLSMNAQDGHDDAAISDAKSQILKVRRLNEKAKTIDISQRLSCGRLKRCKQRPAMFHEWIWYKYIKPDSLVPSLSDEFLRSSGGLGTFGKFTSLASILNLRQADLMHVYFGHTGVYLLPFIKAWNKPVIVSFHGVDVQSRSHQPGYLHQLRLVFEAVPLILARSQSLVDRLCELGCAREKIRLNRTGIPLDAFPFVKREPPKDGAWRLVQACRLIEKKGLDTTLKAFARFRQNYPQATLSIAGVGPELNPLKALAFDLDIAESIQWCGFLSSEELLMLYQTSHLFVHPSRTGLDGNQEGIPNAMLEAMSTGLPVVATRHGGIPEAVKHEESGLLVAENDILALADGFTQYARDTEKWMAASVAASRTVKSEFDQAQSIRILESIYKEAMNMGAPSSFSESIKFLEPIG